MSTLLDKKLMAHYYWTLYPERYASFPNQLRNIWNDDYERLDDGLKNRIDKIPIYPKGGSIFEYDGEIYVKFKEYNMDNQIVD